MSASGKYAIRIHWQAAADIDEAHVHLTALIGELYADAWQNGLHAVIATLATLSRRYSRANEDRLFQNDVWSCPYQFRTSRVVYRILYEIVEDDEDAPYVHILHIRHAAHKPMTRAEARKIEED